MCKAHRLVYHSTLGLRVITKKKKRPTPCESAGLGLVYAVEDNTRPLPHGAGVTLPPHHQPASTTFRPKIRCFREGRYGLSREVPRRARN